MKLYPLLNAYITIQGFSIWINKILERNTNNKYRVKPVFQVSNINDLFKLN